MSVARHGGNDQAGTVEDLQGNLVVWSKGVEAVSCRRSAPITMSVPSACRRAWSFIFPIIHGSGSLHDGAASAAGRANHADVEPLPAQEHAKLKKCSGVRDKTWNCCRHRADAGVRSMPVVGPVSDAEWGLYKQRYISAEGRVIDTGNVDVSHSEGQESSVIVGS